MSLPDPNYQPGDLFTADNANGIINAILERLQSNGFDVMNQTGSQTILTHNVTADKDEIIRLDSYAFVYSGSEFSQFDLNLDFTGPQDSDNTILVTSITVTGVSNTPSFTIKAKRGTTVTLYTTITGSATYDIGGALLVEKLIA